MTMTWGVPVDADKALAWPVEKVALELLASFARGNSSHRYNFLNAAKNAYLWCPTIGFWLDLRVVDTWFNHAVI